MVAVIEQRRKVSAVERPPIFEMIENPLSFIPLTTSEPPAAASAV